jgi:hypothetical protein
VRISYSPERAHATRVLLEVTACGHKWTTRVPIPRGDSLLYVEQIDAVARDPKNVKSPLELELWRVRSYGRILSCDLRCDANEWDVLIRDNGEPLFSRRCASEDEAGFVANGMKQDELKTGSVESR